MQRTDVNVTTSDGQCPAVLVTPDGDGPWPAVIMFPDAASLRPAFVEMASQLAAMGYVCFVPDVYYREGPYEPFQLSDPDVRLRIGAVAARLTKAMAASDTGAFLDYLATLPQVSGTKVGTTGYCKGGGLSLGVVDRIAGRVYVAAAVNDASFPPEQAALLERTLTEAGVDHTIETYPALHGFAVPDHLADDEGAAARHWRALEELFGATLTA